MKSIILLLGSPNDEKGRLSSIAVNRVECAYRLYAENRDMLFLCTGGFGEHFNVTNQPHAFYAKQELIRLGADENAFLPFVLSGNTYEDFTLSKPLIEKELPDVLFIVTSEFHMERVKLLHKRIIDYSRTVFLSAQSTLPKEELSLLIKHEREAIKRLSHY